MGVLDLFSNIFYIIIALLVLLFMVTVHEFGHYVAGRILKFKINEFAIGFGPALFKRTSKHTGEIFSLRLIPLGGFCSFEGTDAETDIPEAFNSQKPWKRIIVLLAGVFMNFMVSLLIAIIVFTASGMYFPSVARVLPDAGGSTVTEDLKLKEGDIILAINGEFLYLNGDLKAALTNAPSDTPFNINVIRNGERINVTAIKRDYYNLDKDGNIVLNKDGTYAVYNGLGIWQGFESYRMGFFESLKRASVFCFRMAGVILGFFGKLITGQIGLNQIGGPITTIDYTVQVARQGMRQLMEIVTLIGVNLAVFNLLPIPALDGSRIVFVIIEWIRKKPVKRELEGKIHLVGLLLLFGFVILADLLQLFGKL